MKPGQQLHLASLDPTPRRGEPITDLGVFTRHICDDAAACPHTAPCMAQPVGPDARCFAATPSATFTRPNTESRAHRQRAARTVSAHRDPLHNELPAKSSGYFLPDEATTAPNPVF